MGGKLKELIRKRKGRLKVKTWVLILMLVILMPIDATLLRFDHIKMTGLRDEVLAADARIGEGGTEEDLDVAEADLAAALVNLKEFVFSNIVINVVEENGVQRVSFGTGPFYLEHQYLRAANKVLEEAEKTVASDNNPNGNIYALASNVCRPQAIQNGWSWNNPNYINCMMTEIQKYPASEDLQDTIVANLPSTELYRRNYASPVWAPTLTGWMILVTLILIVVIFIRGFIWVVLRLSLLFI